MPRFKAWKCQHCGQRYVKARKRRGRFAIVPPPDCGRCWVQIDEVQGYGTVLGFATIKIKD